MICRVGEGTLTGRAVDLRDCDGVETASLDPETVATAVREGAATIADGVEITVLAREAGPLHDSVGCVTTDCSIRPRTALAVAARSRGWTTPVDDDFAAARERLRTSRAGADGEADGEHRPETAASRRELAAVTADVDRLRERAAEARGRLQAGAGSAEADGDAGDDLDGGEPSAGETPLAAAIRELSEAETAAAAARERHRRARDAARARRDRLQERLRREDEVANLEREARAHLVERARAAYEQALAAVPGQAGSGVPSDPFAADPDAMALAVARVGDLSAPVVLACDRFDGATAAARWLGAPVVRL